MGLLLLRAFLAGTVSGEWLAQQISSDAATYAYLLGSTLLVFSVFGFILGRQADRLAEASRTDVLTALSNRRHFQERLDEEFARARRYAQPLALLVIDLDGLKALNDREGHRAGDAALRRVAAAIRRGSRTADVAARWGGDEFVLLAPAMGLDEARRLAERVCTLVEGQGTETGLPPVTVSIGVSYLPPAGGADSPEALLRAADAALYQAKRVGRNCVVTA